jgi:hypothetical protein
MLQLTSERERFTARLQEEQERAEREQQAALAEAVKGQAQLRAELASTVQRVQVGRLLKACMSRVVHSPGVKLQMEEMKRNALQDQHMVKFREQLTTRHELEIEKIHEQYRNEKKKYQVGKLFLISTRFPGKAVVGGRVMCRRSNRCTTRTSS